jgi:hypothetical protein
MTEELAVYGSTSVKQPVSKKRLIGKILMTAVGLNDYFFIQNKSRKNDASYRRLFVISTVLTASTPPFKAGHEITSPVLVRSSHGYITTLLSKTYQNNANLQVNPQDITKTIENMLYIIRTKLNTKTTTFKYLTQTDFQGLHTTKHPESNNTRCTMFAIIEAPQGQAVELSDDMDELKKYHRSIVGTKLSPSGVLFYINRADADDLNYLMDNYKIRFAITTHGVLNRTGDHFIVEFPTAITQTDDSSFVESFYEEAVNTIRDNEKLKKVVGL